MKLKNHTTMINPNDPAFPNQILVRDKNGGPPRLRTSAPGLSIRAELAARAMGAIISNTQLLRAIVRNIHRKQRSEEKIRMEISKESIAMADALISELNKTSS